MDLTFVAIIVLAAMIFVLSGMVGYLYWQQTRLTQQVHSITLALASHLAPPPPPAIPVDVPEEDVQEVEITESEDEDDRVSVEHGVEHGVEHVEGPPPAPPAPEVTATTPQEDDTDDIQHKTVKQLHEILTKKGIPFGKRDSKPVLLELLRATA
jgi:cytoskeletal protein RodZ